MMDRINGLSDEIVCHILSFLTIKESALTSVLSTRWRNLFALTPDLHIEEDDLQEGCGQSFMDFVGRALAVSADLPLRKFSVKCRKSIDSGHVTGWMFDVLERGVLNLDIDVIARELAILVPLEMFTCKTIVELKLARGFEAMVPDHVSLPSLKTLFLGSIYFYNRDDNCVLGRLLAACPLLEELTIRSPRWQSGNFCRTVSSSTLKKLTLKCIRCYQYWDISLDTPNLVYLEYSDLVPREYPVVNLESLVEAKLDLCSDSGIPNPINLIKGLRNVQVLELSSVETSVVFHRCRKAIPVLSNLLRLSITTSSDSYTWECFPILVRKSPNLQTLVIKGPLLHGVRSRQEYGLSCPVKVLKITEFGGKAGELNKLKHFIEVLSSGLELVKVRAFAINDEEKSRITKDLLMVPRSSKCNIQIKFCERTKVMNDDTDSVRD